jgi:hypothetical protein
LRPTDSEALLLAALIAAELEPEHREWLANVE